jgi:hypothetical protein
MVADVICATASEVGVRRTTARITRNIIGDLPHDASASPDAIPLSGFETRLNHVIAPAISFTTIPTRRNVPAASGDEKWRGVLAGRFRTVASTPTIRDRTTTPFRVSARTSASSL